LHLSMKGHDWNNHNTSVYINCDSALSSDLSIIQKILHITFLLQCDYNCNTTDFIILYIISTEEEDNAIFTYDISIIHM